MSAMRGFTQRAVAWALAFGAEVLFAAEPVSLNAWLEDDAAWKTTPATFASSRLASGFSFVDGRRVARSADPNLRFLDFKVWEARVFFERDAVARVALSLYNKGDAGELDQEAFNALIGRVCDAISTSAGYKGVSGKTSNDRANYYVCRRQWARRSVGVQLEWAYVDPRRSDRQLMPFRAEFVNVLLVPAREGNMMPVTSGTPAWANNASARTVKGNVKSNAAGDVWIANVPMVDQGQKGYCAAASAERILRYYGRQVDQHEIAQLADTAAQKGTSLESMVGALEAVGRKYQLDQKDLIRSDDGRSFEKTKFSEMIEQYNRQAKQKKRVPIDYMSFAEPVGPNSLMIDTLKIYAAMDPETLKEARVRQTQGVDGFRKNIVQYTTQGVPLVWACVVGKYEENPPIGQKGAFGHIRIIIGYNAKTCDVLYTDSWGPGHELKRLPLDEAWAMTFGLTVLKPRDVR